MKDNKKQKDNSITTKQAQGKKVSCGTHTLECLVRPFVVHGLAITLCSLGTGWTRKESERKIIEYMEKIERERIRLFGK